MDFGHSHVNSPDDLTVLHCEKCGWRSDELSRSVLGDRGVPWYCDNCGAKNLHWVRFHPSERAQALALLP